MKKKGGKSKKNKKEKQMEEVSKEKKVEKKSQEILKRVVNKSVSHECYHCICSFPMGQFCWDVPYLSYWEDV